MKVSSKQPTMAMSKCIVYFNDGNSRTFYSFDSKHKNSKPDQGLGIRRLNKMLYSGALKGKWKTAIIYDNTPNGKEIAKYKSGSLILQ